MNAEEQKPLYKVSKTGGVLTFEHETKGIATFNINTQAITLNGKTAHSLLGYFMGTTVGNVFEGSSYRYLYSSYSECRKSIKQDIFNMDDKVYGEFLKEKVIPYFYKYTKHGYKNFGNILPMLSSFENMYHWKEEGIICNVITELTPGVLPKSYRDIMKVRNIKLTREIHAQLKIDVEFFKRILMLLHEEKVPYNVDNERWNDTSNNWQTLLEQLSVLRELINDYKYEPKAIFRYIFNYIEPYEGIKYASAIIILRDYASMHAKMDITEFKKYPKFLKSNHDIINNEYKNYKQEYDAKVFSKKVRKELAFKCKEFLVVMPDSPNDIKEEGRQLSHCVGSYIERIVKGETQILFLRVEEEVSLLTLEVRDEVLIQAKGYGNRAPEKKEIEFIKKYAQKKELLVRI